MTAWSSTRSDADGPMWKPNNAPLFGWNFLQWPAAHWTIRRPAGRQSAQSFPGRQPDGFVPNFAHWDPDPPAIRSGLSTFGPNRRWGALRWKMPSAGRTLTFSVRLPKLSAGTPGGSRLANGNHDGLLEWGSNGQGAFEANYETDGTTRRPSRVRKWSATRSTSTRLILIPSTRGSRSIWL